MKRWKGNANLQVRLPITTSILLRIKTHMNTQLELDRMLWAAFTLGTCGLLRLGEFALSKGKEEKALRWRHVDWYDSNNKRLPLIDGKVHPTATEYRLFLEQSKTDPFRVGVTIRICAPIAVTAMKEYCNRLTAPPMFNEALFTFRQMNKYVTLDRDTVVRSIQRYLMLIGESAEDYNGHSFRKGGAQTLAEAHIPHDVIQVMGRWSSDCYKLYISTPTSIITDAALALEPEVPSPASRVGTAAAL